MEMSEAPPEPGRLTLSPRWGYKPTKQADDPGRRFLLYVERATSPADYFSFVTVTSS